MTTKTLDQGGGHPEPGSRTAYGEHPSQFFEFWAPDVKVPRGRAILVHGGWWRDTHDLSLMHNLCRTLVTERWEVFNVEFRRTGLDGGRWPCSLTDVQEALRRIQEFGVPGDGPVVLIGHSAGAHLAMLSCQPLNPALLVALAPVTDLRESGALDLGEGAVADFLGPAYPEAVDDASPVHHVPLGVNQLLVHGTNDLRVPVAQSRSYARKAASAGDQVELVEIAGGDHFCVIDPFSAGCAIWVSQLADWARDSSSSEAAIP